MNWLLLVTVVIILASVLRGFQKGLLRVILSLVGIIVVLVFVSYATPYISSYIEKDTKVYEIIQKNCETYLKNAGTKTIDDKLSKQGDNTKTNATESSTPSSSAVLDNLGKNQEETISTIKEQVTNLKLPEAIQKKIIKDTTSVANTILDESGLYNTISQSMAHIIVSGISFFVAFILGIILLNIIGILLDIIAHLPLVHGVNKIAGAFAGALEGFLIIWILFYFVALTSSMMIGKIMVTYINQSVFLTYLYHNNAILQIAGGFIWR